MGVGRWWGEVSRVHMLLLLLLMVVHMSRGPLRWVVVFPPVRGSL